jgi:cysteine/O-acetylserine efflux protein
MGILHGYRKTRGYLSGIMAGYFLVLLLCSLASRSLLEVFPSFEIVIRIVGALYILWLAWHTVQASYDFDEQNQRVMGFSRGFFLQLLNPKGILFGLTLYSTFLASVTGTPVYLILSVLVMVGVGFASISTWTLFGAAIRVHLKHRTIKLAVNIGLAALLVFTAFEISGIPELLAV